MNSAILYLAIVAIWAVFLVPAWIRRPHATRTADEHADDPAGHNRGDGEHDSGVPDDEAADGPDAGADAGASPGAGVHAGVSGHEHEDRDGASGYPADDDHATQHAPRGAARPSQSREQMMRARRRMLTFLLGMTMLTIGLAVLGKIGWWICVPPAGMLTLYVLLLREIALADAELARRRHAAALSEAHAARRRAFRERAAARDAEAARAAEPGAQIIDISGRVRDQLYDQYADAAARAVGD